MNSENLFGQDASLVNKVENAQNEAKAFGMAVTAMKTMLTGANILDNLNPLKLNLGFPITRVVKIHNIIDPDKVSRLNRAHFDKVFGEITKELKAIAAYTKAFIATNTTKGYGAEPGSLFVELKTKEEAEKLLEALIGKSYDKREIKAVCVPEEAYVEYYLALFEGKN